MLCTPVSSIHDLQYKITKLVFSKERDRSPNLRQNIKDIFLTLKIFVSKNISDDKHDTCFRFFIILLKYLR